MRDYEAIMKECTLCPRNCHANRLSGRTGYCGQTARIRAARAALHYWEEPCISGTEGSGAVFFSGCVLRCVFCQNREIAESKAPGSKMTEGRMTESRTGGCAQDREISPERLAEIFLELQEKKANNINLVTPTHFVPQIAAALERAREEGLRIPVVYNTGSYEKTETLKRMEGLVDIYLPDLKYCSPALGQRYSQAPDYFETAAAAIEEMVRQVGKPVFREERPSDSCKKRPEDGTDGEKMPLMEKGVIVRHLMLPGCGMDSRKVIRYLYGTYGNDIYISIMNQYTPMREFPGLPELNRRVSRREYDRLVDYALSLGVENGFIQEGGTAEESFIPAFNGEGL